MFLRVSLLLGSVFFLLLSPIVQSDYAQSPGFFVWEATGNGNFGFVSYVSYVDVNGDGLPDILYQDTNTIPNAGWLAETWLNAPARGGWCLSSCGTNRKGTICGQVDPSCTSASVSRENNLYFIKTSLFTVEEIASVLDVPIEFVLDLLKSGTLRGIQLAENWKISQQALEDFLRNPSQK